MVWALVVTGSMAVGQARAQNPADEVTVDLSEPVVQITAGFAGTDLLVFGVAPGAGDIVVVVRGPEQNEIVRRKERVFGIWMNREEIEFRKVPAFYVMASNRSLDQFMPGGVADIFQIGLENLQLDPSPEDVERLPDWDEFRHGFLRNKQRQGLYRWDPLNLIFKNNRLFRTTVPFPANVAVGAFSIEVYLIRKGELVAQETQLLNVRKFGVEASVFSFAHRHSLAYGVIAVLIAALAGWVANAAFRRA